MAELPRMSSRHVAVGAMTRPLLGYLRVTLSSSDQDVEQLRRELAAYAGSEGYTLLRVFVDRSWSQTTGFTALVNALKIGESRHLAIPALHHLAHFPGAQLAMKELLESQTGA